MVESFNVENELIFGKTVTKIYQKQFTCLWEHTQKYVTFTVPIEKKATHYQILSIIFLKEFIELNVNSDTIIKNVKYVELNISIATVTLNTKILKMI